MLLLIVGFLVGTFGTLIGAGGGFIMVPFLLFYYPGETPEQLTAISLAVVFLNALSGSLNYAYKKRIDYRSVIEFSLASAPGAVFGIFLNSVLPHKTFEILFGSLLIIVSTRLIFSKSSSASSNHPRQIESGYRHHILIDRSQNKYEYAYSPKLGIGISALVGVISSLLGIGGGIIHVPALVNWLSFPVHIATATSHGVLAFTSLVGTCLHLYRGDLSTHWDKILWLAPGVILGAQLGAQLSSLVKGKWILKALALALAMVGIRLLTR